MVRFNIIGLLVAALTLTACATTSFDPRACPREKEYTREQQKQLSAAYSKAEPIIQSAIDDYGKLRDKARACRGEK